MHRKLAVLVLVLASGCSDGSSSGPGADAGSGGALQAPSGGSSVGGSDMPLAGSSSEGGSSSGGGGSGGSEAKGSLAAGAGTGGAHAGSGGEMAMGGAAGSSGSSGQGGASARGKATVVIRGSGQPTPGDNLMIGRIHALGYQEVVTISDAAADADSVAGSALVVISSSAESGPLQDKLKNIAIPVLCVEDAEFKLMGMATTGGHDAGISQLVVTAGSSPLVGDLTGTVTISTKAGELGWGTPAPAAIIGATMADDPTHAVVFGYEAGAQMSTMAAPARRAGFAIREEIAANLNENGVEVFDSILAWVAR